MFIRNSSSDDSDESDSCDNTKSSFRVSVCLRRYFEDVRARAFILVRPRRRVRWLQRRIRKVFSLPGRVCLRAAGHLLPPAEPLRLLRPDERVEVIPLQEALAECQSGQDVIEHTEAEAQPKEKTSTLLTANCSVTVCDEILPDINNFSIRTNNMDHCEDRNTERRRDNTGSWTDLPSAAADRTAPDAVDAAPGPSPQPVVAEISDESSLLGVKRRALALLDAHCAPRAAPEAPPPPRRARRRVRRRSRRANTSPPPADAPCLSAAAGDATPRDEDASSAASTLRDVARNDYASPATSSAASTLRDVARNDYASPATSSAASTLRDVARNGEASPAASPVASTPRDVARNEDACARKPRMIHSLDVDNV